MNYQPPGWYRNASNELQWWDGQRWGILAQDFASSQKSTSETAPKRKARTWLWTIAGALGIVAALTGVIFMSGTTLTAMANLPPSSVQPTEKSSSEKPSQESEPAPAEEPEPELTFDEIMVADGWAVAEPNETYYRFFTEAEKAESSCGGFRCSWVVVYSANGCESGFYVKADILTNSTPTSWTNAISASARPGESVVVTLESVHDSGDQFRVSELHCMS